jgi:curved DNA-binding protein
MDVYTSHKQIVTVNGKNIRITIPAGIENGQTLKLKGYGGLGVDGGPKGDLFVTFSIENKTEFKRDKADLYTNKEIDLYTAILGGEIMVETMNGKVKLNVKPETQNGARIKLKGKGFPIYKKDGQFGDLYITYSINLPKNLSKKQKDLFEELSKLKN